MNVTVEQVAATKPITIMKIQGALDGNSYLSFIQQAQDLYVAGSRSLLLDLSEMNFLSSAGLIGLHSVVMVMNGQTPHPAEGGWSVIHHVSHEVSNAASFEANCKLLQPQPRVQKTLEITGFANILETFTDRETAIQAFL